MLTLLTYDDVLYICYGMVCTLTALSIQQGFINKYSVVGSIINAAKACRLNTHCEITLNSQRHNI